MQKREWTISLCILCALALVSAGVTAFVLHQNQPEKVEAFESRFMDLTNVDFISAEDMLLKVQERGLELSWESGKDELVLSTVPQQLPENCREWQLTISGGGIRNGIQKSRWGNQVWLELQMLSGETMAASERIEMPLLAEQADRTRIYTLRADAANADSWLLRVMIKPIDGVTAEGSLILKNWEVLAR